MKNKALILLLTVMTWTVAHAQPSNRLDQVLKQYVKNGVVDYQGLKAKPQRLSDYLVEAGALKESEFNTWAKDQQLAFLINLYNASTLQLILDHYPVESIKKIKKGFKGPWDQPVVPFFGDRITLNTLEHKIIRKRYADPRVHMALVCAAKGCPPLRSEAYIAGRLNEQLDDQSRTYLASPSGFELNRKKGIVHISSIFKWYGKDFTDVRAFVEKYSEQSLSGLKIKYVDYDWSLNE